MISLVIGVLILFDIGYWILVIISVMILPMDMLKDLNTEQKKAVTHGSGPLLIVAGAGTGKTTVITRRIAWLILDQKLKANEILALTFTEKAAEEMETRVDKLLPLGYED